MPHTAFVFPLGLMYITLFSEVTEYFQTEL